MTGRVSLKSFTAMALVIAAAVPATSNAVDVRPIIKAGFGLGVIPWFRWGEQQR